MCENWQVCSQTWHLAVCQKSLCVITGRWVHKLNIWMFVTNVWKMAGEFTELTPWLLVTHVWKLAAEFTPSVVRLPGEQFSVALNLGFSGSLDGLNDRFVRSKFQGLSCCSGGTRIANHIFLIFCSTDWGVAENGLMFLIFSLRNTESLSAKLASLQKVE